MGPAGRDKTADDIAVGLYAQRRPDVQHYGPFKGKVSVQDEAIAGGRVAIEGLVKDKTGVGAPRVRVAARRVSNGATIWVYTDSQGHFVIPNLAPGNYHVILESDSFQSTIYRTLPLEAGSRGTVEAVLQPRGAAPITLSLYGRYAKAGGIDLAAPMEMDRERRKDTLQEFRVAGVANRAAMPMAKPESVTFTAGNAEIVRVGIGGRDEKQPGGAEPRVRSFFPETLYTNPSLITDGQGRASIHVPMADS